VHHRPAIGVLMDIHSESTWKGLDNDFSFYVIMIFGLIQAEHRKKLEKIVSLIFSVEVATFCGFCHVYAIQSDDKVYFFRKFLLAQRLFGEFDRNVAEFILIVIKTKPARSVK
jgi:hypothetical protein